MKNILIVEDGEANLESAALQLGDHRLTTIKNMEEFSRQCAASDSWLKSFDVILTDLNVPYGNHGNFGPRVPAETLLPGGFVIALKALSAGIPCAIVTDSNGHNDALGYLVERASLDRIVSGVDPSQAVATGYALAVVTRPNWIDVPSGKGKDWAEPLSELCPKAEHPIRKILTTIGA
jgi:CheY-like chemotaxis protein